MTTVCVALDYNRNSENLAFAKKLSVVKGDYIFKINLDSAARLVDPSAKDDITNYELVSGVVKLGKRVFIDLKMLNGSRTMSILAKQYSELGVALINAYPQAPASDLKKVVGALSDNTELLLMTVYTKLTDEQCMENFGRTVDEQIIWSANKAVKVGAKGLITPVRGAMIDEVRNLDLGLYHPAVRPVWYKNKTANDQVQIGKIADAVKYGSAGVVMGSPIRVPEEGMTQVSSLEKILANIIKLKQMKADGQR